MSGILILILLCSIELAGVRSASKTEPSCNLETFTEFYEL
jgi:hypothetical protein